MANNQGSYNPSSFSSEEMGGQAQMRRNEIINHQSDIHSHDEESTFLQETGTQVKTLAQGAAQGAVSIAKGAAAGAANLAHGAADAMRNTFGINAADNTSTHNQNDSDWPSDANWPSSTNNPSNTNNPAAAAAAATNNPSRPSNPRI